MVAWRTGRRGHAVRGSAAHGRATDAALAPSFGGIGPSGFGNANNFRVDLRALQQATRQGSRFLCDPFPGADLELSRLFTSGIGDETTIVAGVLEIQERRVRTEPVVEPRTWWTTSLLLLGVAATAATFGL